MNDLFAGLMKQATQLTRNGRLAEATQAIQRALRGRDGAAPAAKAHGGGGGAEVIDVESRFVEREPETAPPREAAQPERWTRASFTHQGRAIDYMLFVPAGAVPDRPLVLMLHGCTQDAADFAAGTRMNEVAREQDLIVLYPEQPLRAHGQKCWNWFKPQHQQRGKGEPELLAALTRHIAAQEHADAERVYVAGLSAGGAMAGILAQCYPDIYAAVGVHSGLPPGAATDLMSAMRAMQGGAQPSGHAARSSTLPMIVFHGDADTTVNPSNGRAFVQGRAGGGEEQGRSAKGRAWTRTRFAASAQGDDAEHWRLHGAGHAWSGGSADGSYTDAAGPDASREFLRFFLAHRLKPGPAGRSEAA